MTKEVLTLALEALEASARNWPSDSAIEAITAIKEALSTKCVAQPEKTVCPFCSSEWVTAEQHDRKMDRMEQERCVGCEACIDTACGRDECPKGWPKAAQPEQECKSPEPKDRRPDVHCSDKTCGFLGECRFGYKPEQEQRNVTEQEHDVLMNSIKASSTVVSKGLLAQPEEEPVAWLDEYGNTFPLAAKQYSVVGKHWKPLYTTPPQRKPLTDEQKYALIEKHLGLKQRRDNTVIDQYTGLFYSAKPYFDLINEAAHGIKE